MLRRLQQGQSLVEFALIITVLLTMLLGMVDFGLAYYSQVMIKNAVAEAATTPFSIRATRPASRRRSIRSWRIGRSSRKSATRRSLYVARMRSAISKPQLM